jgi:hypothetical protein
VLRTRKPHLCLAVLFAGLSIVTTIAASAPRSTARFPVYPNARRTMTGANGNAAVGLFQSSVSPAQIRQWYMTALPKAGWEAKDPDRETKFDTAWFLDATHPSLGWKADIMCTRLEGAQTRLNIRVEGSGVTPDVFGEGAAKEAEQFVKKETEKENQRREQAGLPSIPSGPTDLGAAFAAYNAANEDLIKALERFVAQPTVRNIDAALAKAKVYTQRSAELQQRAAKATQSGRGSIAAVGVITSATMDLELGLCVWSMEQAKGQPSTMKAAVKVVEELLREVRKVQAVARSAAKSSEEVEKIDRALKENRPHEPRPVLKEMLAELGQPPYRASTTLKVTRFWTPRSEYWAGALEETWKALRCWNMGCPAGCGGDPFICKAFGEVHDPSPRCLGIQRTPDAERQVLSDPMQVYGLAALSIEVGDPDQLKQGGKIDVSINGHELYSVPLTGSDRWWGNPNPWDFAEYAARMGVASQATMTKIAEMMKRGIDFVYGPDVGEYFQAVSRFPLVPISEAGGGEMNGYVHFLHVGIQGAAPNPDAMLIAPASANWLTLPLKFMDIARANHPALERKSTVRFVATVGGVSSHPVEVEVPGPFMKVASLAGGWNGWPGNSPEDWKFGAGLGPEPQPDYPPKLDVDNDQRHKLLEDTRRFVTLCLGGIFKPWLAMAQKWGTGAFIKKISAPSQIATEQQNIAKAFQNGQGGLMISGSLGRLRTWLMGTGSENYASSFIDKKLGDMFKELTGAAIDVTVGQRYFKQAETFRDKVAVHGDPTYRCLTLEAQNKITNLRGEMWEYVLLAQLHMKGSSNVSKAVGWGAWAVTTWIPATAVAAKSGLYAFDSTLNGANGAVHLYYIVRIVQDYYEIEKLVNNPTSWKQAGG